MGWGGGQNRGQISNAYISQTVRQTYQYGRQNSKVEDAVSIGIGLRALGQRISEIVGHGRELDHGHGKWLEMMGFRTKGHLAGFQTLKCRNNLAIEW